jgi:hypothetical protein
MRKTLSALILAAVAVMGLGGCVHHKCPHDLSVYYTNGC